MIKRTLTDRLIKLAKKFPVVAVMGPRQSGKTTLVRACFPDFTYVSLEDFDTRQFAETDPRGFLASFKGGTILDEIQKVPVLFSYLQTLVDERKKAGQFILTGSSNFLLHEKISQSLAGRVALVELLPFSLEELSAAGYKIPDMAPTLWQGFYPRLYDKKISPSDFYPSYIQTYIERDVRQIKNISNLSVFQRFLKLCAGRVGQLFNLSSVAVETGITHNTAKAWVSLLESSFIVFLLRPYYGNFNKRLIKMPKLYFYDVGLVCSLLGIEQSKQLDTHYLTGHIFENLMIAEVVKYRFHHGKLFNYFFWRDKTGHEVDCVIESADKLIPIEIKSGKTVADDCWHGLKFWYELRRQRKPTGVVVYGGDDKQNRRYGRLISWKNFISSFLTDL